ncbi:hypothetical protein [Cohnella sp. GCM10027633]|uniref:hypothetical protein n=1 Tax=unclassified Cohnella TaxID=2636738 RepID=UPI0036302E3A
MMSHTDVMVVVGAVILLLAQSTWLYIDARQRSRYPWFWAIWGLIQCPTPLIFYWWFVRRKRK